MPPFVNNVGPYNIEDLVIRTDRSTAPDYNTIKATIENWNDMDCDDFKKCKTIKDYVIDLCKKGKTVKEIAEKTHFKEEVVEEIVRKELWHHTSEANCARECLGMVPIGFYPVRMWTTQNGCTTVQWNDGKKTTVRCENPEKMTEFGGFAAALAKRYFGSSSKAVEAMEEAKERAEAPAKQKAEERDRVKKLKQRRHEERQRRREEEIQNVMEQMRIEKIAADRLMRQGEVEI